MNLPPLSPETEEQLKKPLRIEVKGFEALMILATLQLALRHPTFKNGNTAKWVEGFARGLQKGISDAAPGTAFLCEAGWQPHFDR